MGPPSYKLRVSNRARSYHLEIDWREGLVVIVPKRWSQMWVDRIILNKSSWIKKHLAQLENEKNSLESVVVQKLSAREILTTFQNETKVLAAKMNLTFNSLSVRSQRTRWGSCSSRGNLSFNNTLISAPKAVREYVIIHELVHLIVHNHSLKFWRLVELYCPDYKNHRSWLRKNGRILSNGTGLIES